MGSRVKIIFGAILLSSLGASTTFAQAYVDLGIQVGMQVSASGIKKHKTGTVNCNPFGRSPNREPLNWGPLDFINAAGNGRYEKSATAVYPVDTVWAGHSWRPRTLSVKITQEQEKSGATVMTIELVDQQSNSTSATDRGDCHTSDWQAIASKDLLNGKIEIGYKMPKSVWAVSVTRLERTGVFQSPERSQSQQKAPVESATAFNNMLNKHMDPRVINSEFIAWGMPESDVSQVIEFSAFVAGQPVSGRYKIRFMPMVSSISAEQSKSLLEKTNELIEGAYPQKEDKEFARKMTSHVVSLVADQNKLQQFSDEISTQDLYALIGKLNKLMNQAVAKSQFWHIKASAAILNYELSLRLLQTFGPFCETREVDLPLLGKRVTVSGLRMAFLYLARAQARVEKYKFSTYEAMIDQLLEFSKKGLTYSAVSNNADTMAKLRKSYEILQNAAGSGVTPFAAALDEVQFILTQFKSVGAGEATTATIKANLTELGGIEKQFVTDFVLRLKQFRANNQSAVDVSDLKTRLDKIVEMQAEIAHLMQHNVRFLSLDDSNSTDNVISMILDLISNNVRLFTEPLENSFEPIRAAYNKVQDPTKIVERAQRCLTEGMADEAKK